MILAVKESILILLITALIFLSFNYLNGYAAL